LTLLAAGVRAWSWQRAPLLFNDGPVFLGLAQLIDAGLWGQALAHPFHPLYPAAIRLVHGLVPGWERAAVTVSVLAGAMAVPLLFGLVRRVLDRGTAWLAATALAVHPYAVVHAGDVQSDGLYLVLFLAAVLVQWRALTSRRAAGALAAGALAGAAYLVRPEGIGVAVVGALAACAGLGGGGPGAFPWRRRLAWVSALLGGVALVASPYLLALHARNGAWMLTQKKSAARLAGLDVGPWRGGVGEWLDPEGAAPLRRQRPFLETVVGGPRVPDVAGVGAVGSGPLHAGVAVALARGVAVVVAALRPELLALLIVGIAARRGRAGAGDAYLAGLAALYLAVLAALAVGAGYVSKRHALPVAVLGLGHAALGARVVGRRVAGWLARPGPPPAWAATLVALLLLVVFSAAKLARPRSSGDLAERRAAEWVASRVDRGAGVAAGRLRLAYYADAPYVPLPEPEPGMDRSRIEDSLLAYLRASGVRYVIADDRRIETLDGLGRALASGAHPVHRVEAGGRVARVFRLDPARPASGAGAERD
jgi:hypothetical protein